jgi:hypothetical protein
MNKETSLRNLLHLAPKRAMMRPPPFTLNSSPNLNMRIKMCKFLTSPDHTQGIMKERCKV